MVLVWDMGASYGLTLFRSDFIDYVKFDLPVKGVTKVNRAIGIVTISQTNIIIMKSL